MDLIFLLLAFGLNKRVSSFVVTTLRVGTGSEGGRGKFVDEVDDGGDWLLCDELLIVGDGVVERFGAGGHQFGFETTTDGLAGRSVVVISGIVG